MLINMRVDAQVNMYVHIYMYTVYICIYVYINMSTVTLMTRIGPHTTARRNEHELFWSIHFGYRSYEMDI